MEVKIQIPDNCELVKDGDTYIVKEKDNKPRSWEEFCKNNPIKKDEAYILHTSSIKKPCEMVGGIRDINTDKNFCTSKKEAEAFLALMQLRQLRKAWVGDWYPIGNKTYVAITATLFNELIVYDFINTSKPLSFPTKEMAEDFLNCFRDLCETAKILL